VIDILGETNGLLERCMKTMDVSVPRALLRQNISKVKNLLADGMPRSLSDLGNRSEGKSF
jgi:hypothetical protein